MKKKKSKIAVAAGSRGSKKIPSKVFSSENKAMALAKVLSEKVAHERIEDSETKIRKLTLQLEQANNQLDQYAHTTSHEFQEPLRKITVLSRFLQQNEKKAPPRVVKEYLGKIEIATVRMTKLVDDMINFSAISNYEKLFVKTDFNEILRDVEFDFELVIAEKKARIHAHKLPVLEAVPFQMNQLFYDIIDNALKFSRPDVPPIIEISSHKIKQEDLKFHPQLNQNLRYYEIIFKDNGIGFNQKYSEQMFTMFQRLSNGGNYPGTGNGLALCRKIAQTYSGEIYAKGTENKGASIHVVLPIQQPARIIEDLSTILKTWL